MSKDIELSTQTTVYCLDDDCLLEVFKYLTFDELLQVANVCLRFAAICKLSLRKIRFFELDYRALLARKDDQSKRLEDIFTSIGSHLLAFKFSGGFIMGKDLKRSIITNMTLNCISLQHLSINYIELSDEMLTVLKPLLSHLTGLDLGRCALQDDAFGKFITGASKLTTLAIPGNDEIDGSFFDAWSDCTQLEQLDISYCYSLNVGRLEAFLTKASNLKGVDVTACQWLKKNKDVFNTSGRSIKLGAILPEFRYYKKG